jgi:23S rRNA (uridine2552-2'-O)-methyltransferase
MRRSKSSQHWLKEHFDDPYVKLAQKEGYRSRAAYKLLEIQEKDRLLKPGMVVVDLGAAPGSWSEVASRIVGPKGKIFALDMLAMEPLPHVEFIQGDFTNPNVYEKLLQRIDNRRVDLVISDIAPNMSGMNVVDQPRAMYLAELGIDFAKQALKTGGSFLVKVFQGEGFDDFLKMLRHNFTKVYVRKPKASRARSNEVYLLARGFKGILIP